MSNLPPGVTDAMCEQRTMSPITNRQFEEQQAVQDELDNELPECGDAILMALIDLDVIDGYPDNMDEASEVIDAVNTVVEALSKDFAITRKPNPADPQRDDVWVRNDGKSHVHVVGVTHGNVHYQKIGEPNSILSNTRSYFKDRYKLIAPERG